VTWAPPSPRRRIKKASLKQCSQLPHRTCTSPGTKILVPTWHAARDLDETPTLQRPQLPCRTNLSCSSGALAGAPDLFRPSPRHTGPAMRHAHSPPPGLGVSPRCLQLPRISMHAFNEHGAGQLSLAPIRPIGRALTARLEAPAPNARPALPGGYARGDRGRLRPHATRKEQALRAAITEMNRIQLVLFGFQNRTSEGTRHAPGTGLHTTPHNPSPIHRVRGKKQISFHPNLVS
jgi:hypothetical protein